MPMRDVLAIGYCLLAGAYIATGDPVLGWIVVGIFCILLAQVVYAVVDFLLYWSKRGN